MLALAAYLAELAWHPGPMLDWYDLNVYNHAGLIARSLPRQLYAWQLQPGIKFTYTPFAARGLRRLLAAALGGAAVADDRWPAWPR